MVKVPKDLLEALAATLHFDLLGSGHSNGSAKPQGANNGMQSTYSKLLVERWLTDMGRTFKLKGSPASRQRAVWTLECPMNAAHGAGKETCIMQEPSGKMSAKCMHDSCAGYGWQDFKDAIGAPQAHHYDPPLKPKRKRAKKQKSADQNDGDEEAKSRVLQDARPMLDADCEDLPQITPQAWQALIAVNKPPRMFRYGGIASRIEPDDDGYPITKPLTNERVQHELARAANFTKLKKIGKEYVEVSALPPRAVVQDILATPDKPFPVLLRIIGAPIFAKDGTLHNHPGYNPATRAYYEPVKGFILPPIPDSPSQSEIAAAAYLIAEELLGDFPFWPKKEKAHAIAAMILPFVRDMIEGPTPLHMFEKPTPGTGATLMIEAITFPALGRHLAAMTEGRDEDEWRKRVFGKLCGAPAAILIDNIRRRVDSAALSSAITAWPRWEDRILGKSEMMQVPVSCLWLGTGNNPVLSNEISRRTIRSRLDAKMDRPWLRDPKSFRHEDLRQWMTDNRAALVAAVLTLVRGWLVAGRPEGKQTLGMFESWAKTIGGILAHAGIDGFLENLDEFYEESDAEGAGWRAFVAAWWSRYEDQDVGVSDLWPLCEPLELTGDSEKAQRTRLGKMLSAGRDRVWSVVINKKPMHLRLQRAGKEHKATMWNLVVQPGERGEHQGNIEEPRSPAEFELQL